MIKLLTNPKSGGGQLSHMKVITFNTEQDTQAQITHIKTVMLQEQSMKQ